MRTRLPVVVALLVCAAFTVAVAGCGGDDESSTTAIEESGATGAGGVALTEDQFLAQGNAICAAGNKELDQAANDTFSGGQPTQAQIEQYAKEVLVPSVQGQIGAIGALTPPEDLADQVDSFLSEAQDALDEVEADPSLLAASENDGPFAGVNATATEIGLTECAA